MSTSRKNKLTCEETGSYLSLSAKPNPDKLHIVFSPSLGSLLSYATKEKGAPLTKGEVERILAKAPAIAVTKTQAIALRNDRGYEDIDPKRAYECWIEAQEEENDD
ncbi:hypothetical protein LOC68_07085 [Blastopirellula sp. JC732]|uniref:Uncharacterized protein n=1 Tax=Blastopirellula sediminis TaxID=2894196 RepID=A0A9X1SIL1_9BACT|nr:hypothetical protein [Blastopirellula sediminis]MCC9609069.1 hypothetical protein [Blastopirellula sediminis]MCC9628154.1 hypothetical protein [Blastopirellula sediminis]